MRNTRATRDHPARKRWAAVWTFLLPALVLGCHRDGAPAGPTGPTENPVGLSTIELQPGVATIAWIGGSTQLSATVKDAEGNVVTAATVQWVSIDPSIASVSPLGLVIGVAAGQARIEAKYGAAADTAIVTVNNQQQPTGSSSLTPAALVPVLGPIVSRDPANAITGSFDNRFVVFENRVLCNAGGCVKAGYPAQLDLVNAGAANMANHYGALRGRLMWAIRNGEPYGPGVTDVTQYTYARGRHIVKEYLKWSKAHDFWNQAHNNTGLADVEAIHVLEGDPDALTHIHASAQANTYDAWGYLHMVSTNSDFRQPAVALQAFNAAHRLGIPYSDVRKVSGASGGPSLDPGPGSWKAAGERLIAWLLDGDPNFKHASKGSLPTPPAILPDGAMPAPAALQKWPVDPTNVGRSEVYFMNAMLATEFLRWSAFVSPHPRAEQTARLIIDHLIDELDRRGVSSLPFVGKNNGSADDLAGFFIWPALVLWQETGDQKYRDFAMKNLEATDGAYLWGAKQFNEAFSLGGHGAEALMTGADWR